MFARENLKDFRLQKRMSQAVFAKEIGYSREMYRRVESGESDGSFDLWSALQIRFGVADADMWNLIKKTKKRG